MKKNTIIPSTIIAMSSSNFGDSSKETSLKWTLLKYARYIGTPEKRSRLDQDWKVVVSSTLKPVNLCITENNHILVIFDQHILVNTKNNNCWLC